EQVGEEDAVHVGEDRRHARGQDVRRDGLGQRTAPRDESVVRPQRGGRCRCGEVIARDGGDLDTGEDAVLSAINALNTASTAIAKALGLKDGAKPDEIVTAVNSTVADRKAFAKAAGAKEDDKADVVVASIATAMSAGSPDPTRFVPIAVVTELRDEVKQLREDTTADKAEEAVAQAMKAGKLTPGMKGWGLDLYKKDKAAFENFVGAQPTLTTPQLNGGRKPSGGNAEGLDETQLAVCRTLGLDPKQYAETLKAEREAHEENA
ncbi:MAG: hypothetical protein J0H60_09760, partial [Rhizobiales bacterium]|nr:hypothetical protein [Hyphomicrobiales bacterium]